MTVLFLPQGSLVSRDTLLADVVKPLDSFYSLRASKEMQTLYSWKNDIGKE